MRDHSITTVNKYGKEVYLPPQTGNSGVKRITAILDECGIPYEEEYRINADGCRRSPFDIAVLKDGEPKLFIEYDGEEHYDSGFFLRTGVREGRCKAHVVKTAIGDAKKTAIAAQFGIPILRVNALPDDAKRPADKRIVTGRYIKSGAENEKKPLPVGISDYIRTQSEYYYVDKTLLIKEFLDRKAFVSLFTRPRRFGKTLNMDMLRVFFEISDEDTSGYFTDKEIWRCGDEYRKHQGKYPVIFLTFMDLKYDSWEATFAKISGLLQEEFGRHSELQNSDKLEKYEKDYFEKILNGQANEVELSASLQKLSKMLAAHYKKAPIIIDEYDTPIQEGYSKEFYDEIIGFMRNFFSGAFKDNSNLSYGFLTGILRIAQESLFSQDAKKLHDGIGEYLKKSISFYDAGAEEFYHGLVLGLIALMDNQYRIRSNRESGDGRYDISMFPRENKYPGMIMELKWDKDLNDEGLDALSAEALDQINDRSYDTEMLEEGVTDIIKFGIAFSGKKVKIRTE